MKIFNWLFAKDEDGPSFEVAEIAPAELAEELTNVRKEIDHLQAEHAAEIAAKAEKIDGLVNQLAEAEAEKASLTATIADKDEAIVAAEKSADQKANAILAQVGHEPVPVSAEPTVDVVAQYRAMKAGPERMKFREDNLDALREAGAIR